MQSQICHVVIRLGQVGWRFFIVCALSVMNAAGEGWYSRCEHIATDLVQVSSKDHMIVCSLQDLELQSPKRFFSALSIRTGP